MSRSAHPRGEGKRRLRNEPRPELPELDFDRLMFLPIVPLTKRQERERAMFIAAAIYSEGEGSHG